VAATQRDPLKELAEHDASVFVFQQAGFAVILVFQMALIGTALCGAAGSDEVSTDVWLMRLGQCCFIFFFGFIYYRLVWTPTMMDESPKTEKFGSMFGFGEGSAIIPYTVTALGFMLNLGLEWRLQGLDEEAGSKDEEKDA